jgi:hypothetical protein
MEKSESPPADHRGGESGGGLEEVVLQVCHSYLA